MTSKNTKNVIKATGLTTGVIGVLILILGLFTHAFALFYVGIFLAMFGFPIYLIGRLEDKSN